MSELKGEVSEQLYKICRQVLTEVKTQYDAIMKDVAHDTADDLQQTSPPRGRQGPYARSWRVKKLQGRYIVHNKDHYRLTHLLEYPHEIRNQYGGPYGESRADPHIKRAEQRAIEELYRKINGMKL